MSVADALPLPSTTPTATSPLKSPSSTPSSSQPPPSHQETQSRIDALVNSHPLPSFTPKPSTSSTSTSTSTETSSSSTDTNTSSPSASTSTSTSTSTSPPSSSSSSSSTPSPDLSLLMHVIHEIAQTGENTYSWPSVRHLLSWKLHQVIADYNTTSPSCPDVDGESFELRYQRAQQFLNAFQQAPFTIQRMCELLSSPRKYYSTLAKFFLAFSKLVNGISGRLPEDGVWADDNSEMKDDENTLLGGGSLAIVTEASGLTPGGVGMLDGHEDGSMSDEPFTVETHYPQQHTHHQDAPASPSQTHSRLSTTTSPATTSPTSFKSSNDHPIAMETE